MLIGNCASGTMATLVVEGDGKGVPMARLRNSPRECIPFGAWPLEMRADMAAAYVDEPSVEAFMAKVARGIYPQPRRQRGSLPKWRRGAMNYHVAQRHGLPYDQPWPVEDLEHLI